MFRAAACAILCLTMLSACGLKGPLYIPDPSVTRDPQVTMPAPNGGAAPSSETVIEAPAPAAEPQAAGSVPPAAP
jgi:predicted small lipoprotein YifL